MLVKNGDEEKQPGGEKKRTDHARAETSGDTAQN